MIHFSEPNTNQSQIETGVELNRKRISVQLIVRAVLGINTMSAS